MREERLILPHGYTWSSLEKDIKYKAENLDKCGPLGSVICGNYMLYTTPGLDAKQGRRKNTNPLHYIYMENYIPYFVVNANFSCVSNFLNLLDDEERASFEEDLLEIFNILGM